MSFLLLVLATFFFNFLCAIAEGGDGHSAQLGGCGCRQCAFFPVFVAFHVVARQGFFRSAEFDASKLGGGYALSLAFFDVVALAFGHEGQNLEHQIGDEGAHQVLPDSRV